MARPLEQLEGKYEILEKLQEGGMGAIYTVRHRLLGEIRVVKVIRPHLQDESTLRDRFLQEARAAARLTHPGIARVFDFTVDEDENAYLVMEYIRGITLGELIRAGQIPPLDLGLEIARQALSALGHMHRQQIVHRDVAPDNLMLSLDDTGAPRVKLIDLGLAKIVEGVTGGLTSSGIFLGKFRYAAPEQFDDCRAGDPASATANPFACDLYSVGLVLYELLTGVYPIQGETATSLIAGHLFRPPVPFETSDPAGSLPEGVRRILLQALAKAPQDRPPSADAFAAALSLDTPGTGYDTPAGRRILELARNPPRPSTYRPGSTQVELDQHFAPVPTPLPQPPTPSPTPARPTPTPPSVDAPGQGTVVIPISSRPSARPFDPEKSTVVMPPAAPGVSPLVSKSDHDAPWSEPSTPANDTPSSADGPPVNDTSDEISSELPTQRLPLDGLAIQTPLAIPQVATAPTEALPTSTPPVLPPPPTSPAAKASWQDLDEAVAELVRMIDTGHASAALGRLQIALEHFGAQPQLLEIRSRLGAALLDRDADVQHSEDPFGTVTTLDSTALGPLPPRPVAGPGDPPPSVTGPSLLDPYPGVTPAASGGSAGLAELDLDGRHGRLDDRSIHLELRPGVGPAPGPELSPPIVPNDGRSMSPGGRNERPGGHDFRRFAFFGLLAVAVLAATGWWLSRTNPSGDDSALPVEDVQAAQLTPGIVLLDAQPWGQILELEDQNGERPPFSGPPSTPRLLSLPPGTYRLVLGHPPSGHQEETTFEVVSGERQEIRFVLSTLEPDQYFEAMGW